MEVSLFSFLSGVVFLLAIIVFMLISTRLRLNYFRKKLESAENVQFALTCFSQGNITKALYHLGLLERYELSTTIAGAIQQMFIKLAVSEIKELRFCGRYKDMPSFLTEVFYDEVPRLVTIQELANLIIHYFGMEIKKMEIGEKGDYAFFEETMISFLPIADFKEVDETNFGLTIKTGMEKEGGNLRRDVVIKVFSDALSKTLSANFSFNEDQGIVIHGRLIELAYKAFPV